jgi:hypothetical protein
VITPAPPSNVRSLRYTELLAEVTAGNVERVEIRQGSGRIDGVLTSGAELRTQGPPGGLPDGDIALLDRLGVDRD